MTAPPDLRLTFKAISGQMRAEFERTQAIRHAGGRGAGRELALIQFLQQHLPAKYGVGRGQVAHWNNLLSRECDVVVYDHLNTPRLMPDAHHSLFPSEAVFATVEVKSVLTADELRDSFAKAYSAYCTTLDPDPYLEPYSGSPPIAPFTAVFAYRADRTLDAIAQQALREWPPLGSSLRPPALLIVVLEEGTVELGHAEGQFRIRRTKDLTLLRFFMQLLSALQAMELPVFRLKRYLQMPELLDGRRVRQTMNAYDFSRNDNQRRIGVRGLRKILAYCEGKQPTPYGQYCRDQLGMPEAVLLGKASNRPTYEYNPRGLDLSVDRVSKWPSNNRVPVALVQIDEANYIVEKEALDVEDFEHPDEPELDEFFC